MNMIKQFFNDESGATMVEYAIMAAFLAIAVAVIVVTLQLALTDAFEKVVDCFDGTDPTCVPPATP
ncbi:MAG: Flp family type IVb pilin [Gammaproteobacteria bacterium]|nr:Flp family type IVb pilin [Gammaproteobacteria bacterium]